MAVRHRATMIKQLAAALRLATRPGSPSLMDRLRALPRLVRATADGTYQGTTLFRLAMLFAAVAYVVSPVDLIPEGFLTVFGLADDALVLSWLAANVVTETEDFMAWETSGAVRVQSGTGPTVQGRVVR